MAWITRRPTKLCKVFLAPIVLEQKLNEIMNILSSSKRVVVSDCFLQGITFEYKVIKLCKAALRGIWCPTASCKAPFSSITLKQMLHKIKKLCTGWFALVVFQRCPPRHLFTTDNWVKQQFHCFRPVHLV